MSLDFKAIKQFESAFQIVKTLQSLGFEAVFAGGSIRDLLIQRSDIENIDIDVATSAGPEVVENAFTQTLPIGKSFGVIRVVLLGHSVEVATFRSEGTYSDGRRPDQIQFSSKEEDAIRRDFTVNALFYDPISEVLYDYVGGLADLKNRVLRAVGNPQDRFREDELRRLRLIRFISQIGFQVEPRTWQAIQGRTEGLAKLSLERITEEIFKLWKGRHLFKALPLFKDSGIAEALDPFWKSSPLLSPRTWQLVRDSDQQIWWHYFYCLNGLQDLKSSFQRLKLSNQMQKSILRTAEAFVKCPEFFKLTYTQQRIQISSSEALWALDAFYGPEEKWLNLRAQLLSEDKLPIPLLTGNDLLQYLQGPEIKKALTELYERQVEQGWQSREQALQGLQEFLLDVSK